MTGLLILLLLSLVTIKIGDKHYREKVWSRTKTDFLIPTHFTLGQTPATNGVNSRIEPFKGNLWEEQGLQKLFALAPPEFLSTPIFTGAWVWSTTSKALYFPVCIMSPPTLLHLAALMGPPATGDLKISPFDLSWHRGKNKTKRQAGFKTFLTKAIKNSEDKESM